MLGRLTKLTEVPVLRLEKALMALRLLRSSLLRGQPRSLPHLAPLVRAELRSRGPLVLPHLGGAFLSSSSNVASAEERLVITERCAQVCSARTRREKYEKN